MSTDLVVVGNISQDSVTYGKANKKIFWGGAGLNISLAAAYAGKKPKLISIVGRDCLDLLFQLEHSVDISLVRVLEGKSCCFQIKYSEDGILERIYCDYGVAEGLNSHLKGIRVFPAHYHISCRNPLKPNLFLQRLTRNSVSFSLDFIKSSILSQAKNAEKWFQYAEYIFVNSEEFRILQRSFDVNIVKRLVVTKGEGPVTVLSFGREMINQSCSSRPFTDVTGAGDVFIGSFLTSQLNGEELEISINKSIIAAQESLKGVGVWGL